MTQADPSGPGKRTGPLPVFLTLLAVLAAAAVLLAAQGFATHPDNSTASRPTVTLTTTVQPRLIKQVVTGHVVTKPQMELAVPRYDVGGTPPIVTREGARVGTTVQAGESLVALSERPIFLLAGALPAYRTLGPGATGTDVAQLQVALRSLGYKVGDKPGVYAASTAAATFAFYSDRSYQAVDTGGSPIDRTLAKQASVPFGEIRFVTALPVVTTTSCGETGEIAADSLCDIDIGTESLVVSVTKSDAGGLVAGQTVNVSLTAGGKLQGILGQPTPVKPAKAASTSDASSEPLTVEYAISVAPNTTLKRAATGVAEIVIASSGNEDLGVEVLAVNGVHSDAWLVDAKGTKVPVDVGLCAAGYCVVSGQAVRNGLRVRLPSTTAPEKS